MTLPLAAWLVFGCWAAAQPWPLSFGGVLLALAGGVVEVWVRPLLSSGRERDSR